MLTLASALDRARRIYGAERAIVDYERNFTWSEHVARVARAAGMLRERGLVPGDRFAVLSRNNFRQCELLHAGYWGGMVPVPVNIRLAPPEIAFILNDSGAKLIAIEDVLLEVLDAEALAPWRDRAICLSPGDEGGALLHYESLIAAADEADLHEAAEDDVATLLYTGGTTGRSKGVRLSHLNVVSNGMQVAATCGYRRDDVYLHVAPMFHAADLLGTGFTLLGGAHAYLPQFSPAALLGAIQDLRVSSTMLAPTMIIMTLQGEDAAAYDLGALRWMLYGSAPMAAEWTRKTLEAFPGAEVVQGYGLTETSPILTVLGMAEHRVALESGDHTRLRSIGLPILGVDMRILTDDGDEAPIGAAGEIVVRGPNVSGGYLELPDATAAAFRDGWFHTGDMARMDEDGYVYLLDRRKDVIITGGENVYSSEVEAALYQHPGVSECAVVGVPDNRYGEALFAAIVPAPGATLDAESVIAHCRERIGGYKIPRQMAFLEGLPKSAMGKVLKTELRRIYADPAAREGQA